MNTIRTHLRTALPAILLGGCVEYELGSKDDVSAPHVDTGEPEAPVRVGDITVSPEAVNEFGLCGELHQTVTVTNDGDGDLTILDITLSGDGWTATLPTLPMALAPLAQVEIPIIGTPGTGEITIESDDPDEPFVIVPLVATADQPPTVSIVSPLDSAVLFIGAPALLEATVDDLEDGPESLILEWSSSIDGMLSDIPADSTGLSQFLWDASSRSDGSQSVSLLATDSCGQTAVDTIGICQQAGYTEDELVIEDWHFEGVANWDLTNDWLELTGPDLDSVGSAFETAHTVSGDSVDIQFRFYIGDGTGADGISLTALDTSRYGGVYLGGTGCGIGFGGNVDCTAGPALPGWSVEIDTWYNDEVDPTTDDHVAFYFDGNLSSMATWATLPEMEDTGWHDMSVSVSAPHVTVTIDGVTYIDTELEGAFSFPAWVGFTAGTGGSTNRHLIDSLTVTEYACEE